MNDREHDFLVSLQTGAPGSERFNRVMLKLDLLLAERKERLTQLVSARAYAAGLDPDDVLRDTLKNAFEHLRAQSLGEKCFEFRGEPKFEGWFMSLASDHRKKRKGGVIPTLLKQRERRHEHEKLVGKFEDIPGDFEDETASLLQSIDLEKQLAGLAPEERCLFELSVGALNASPSAASIVLHARQTGMRRASIASLGRRAAQMKWPNRKEYKLNRTELAMLFELSAEEVRTRLNALLLRLREGLDLNPGSPPHWSAAGGHRRQSQLRVDY